MFIKTRVNFIDNSIICDPLYENHAYNANIEF